jgi:hypothetical protein
MYITADGELRRFNHITGTQKDKADSRFRLVNRILAAVGKNVPWFNEVVEMSQVKIGIVDEYTGAPTMREIMRVSQSLDVVRNRAYVAFERSLYQSGGNPS